MSLEDRIAQMLAEKIDAKLDAILGEVDLSNQVDTSKATVKAANVVPIGRKRRSSARIGVPSTLYKVLQPKADPELFKTADKVWKALKKAKHPMSNADVEKATGLGKKTVQSCIWFLRNHNAKLERLPKAGSKGALVGSVAAE